MLRIFIWWRLMGKSENWLKKIHLRVRREAVWWGSRRRDLCSDVAQCSAQYIAVSKLQQPSFCTLLWQNYWEIHADKFDLCSRGTQQYAPLFDECLHNLISAVHTFAEGILFAHAPLRHSSFPLLSSPPWVKGSAVCPSNQYHLPSWYLRNYSFVLSLQWSVSSTCATVSASSPWPIIVLLRGGVCGRKD